MSYTRSYHGSINVSGSVTVSYPPSEHGGIKTVDYSRNVPVTFDVVVATEPFDQSIAGTNMQVDGLTASVAAMNTANCLAIKQSSDRISDSLVDGFYSLIQSDISTKRTEANAQIQTKSALLLAHSKAVNDKHERMLSDVERERAKYGKVFKDLDMELQRRITEIDRPAFNLSKKIRDEIMMKPHLTAAAETAEQLGTGNKSGSISVANLRSKVSAVLQNLSDSLHNNLMYRHTMRDILWNKNADDAQQEYIPVAYRVSEDISDGRSSCTCYTSDNARKDGILASVNSYVSARRESAARDIPKDEMNLIEQAFSSMVQDTYTDADGHDEYSERVFAEILRLFSADYPNLKQV